MLRHIARLLFAGLGLMALGTGIARAQSGQISGRVTDQQGAAIPGAAVEIINMDRNFKRESRTNEEGAYAAPYLPAGRYQIDVQREGFGGGSREVQLAPGQAFILDIQMTVASTNAEVRVEAETANHIDLENATLATTISNEEIAGYGLNGRNFSQLITMAPGVSNQTGQDEAKVGVAGSAKFSVNGGRVEYNTFEIDGSDVLNTSINTSRGQGEPLMVYPSIDAIQEMKVVTGDYSALYGKSASGSVVVTTKSGGPEYHGNLYGFLRNEAFNARNYFDLPGRTPLYRRQDYGGTIGGPLSIPGLYNRRRDRTFFFLSEEIRLEKTPVDYNQAVPTSAERGEDIQNLGQGNFTGVGDFSDVCPQQPRGASGPGTFNPTAYPDCPRVPVTGVAVGSAYQAGDEVGIGYLSQAVLNSKIIPEPNSTFGCDTTNPTMFPRCYAAAVSPPTNWREELFRLDQVLSSSQQLGLRYIHDAWDTTTLTPQWGVVENSFPTVENRFVGPGLDLVASLAQAFPHGLLNRLAASYAVQNITLAPQPGPGVTSLDRPAAFNSPSCSVVTGPTPGNPAGQQVTECPMGYIFNNSATANGALLPGFVFQGTNGAYGGHGFAVDTGYAPWNQANPTYSVRDDLSRTWGRHTVQLGLEATYGQQNELSAVTGANSGDLQGLVTFSNQQSRYTSGNAFADFLAGPGIGSSLAYASATNAFNGNGVNTAIKSFTQDSGQRKYYNRYRLAEIYLEDDLRLGSRLTLNLGLRASLFGTWYNARGTAWNWRPEAYDRSLGGSILVDGNAGYLVHAADGAPVPLDQNNLDPAITNGLVQCGKDGIPASCMQRSLFHPGPRLGVSWDPSGDGRTAIHGGYGLFWEHGTGYEANVGSLIGSAPLVLSETQSNPPGLLGRGGSYNTIGYSCQGGAAQCGSVSPGTSVTFPLNVTSIPTRATYPYTQQWSLSVEREMRKNLVAQLAYVGTRGTRLTAVRDINQIQPLPPGLNPFGPGQPMTPAVCQGGATVNVFDPGAGTTAEGVPATASGIGPATPGWNNMVVACTGNQGFARAGVPLGTSADAFRLLGGGDYPGLGNIISVENIANSSYHALQGTLREVTGPVTVGVAYTYSHSIDDSSDRSSANFTNSLDIRSNRGSSDFDQRHLLNINYIYSLPLVRWLDGLSSLVGGDEGDAPSSGIRGPASTSPVRNLLLDNWQLSGITTFQTGSPFSVINGGGQTGVATLDNAGVGDGLGVGSYPDVVRSPNSIKPRAPSGSNGSTIGPLLGNPGAFVAPRGLTFGDAGRNFMNNPSRINFNLSLLKHFKVFAEKGDIEFRAEAFNVFNHTQFRIYDSSHPGNTGNNVINCYGTEADLYAADFAGDQNNPSCLDGNSFLHPVDAHDPRILQFAMKMSF